MRAMIGDPYSPYKVLHWSRRLRKIAGGGIPSPVTVMIDPTNACSYRCIFCSSAGAPRGASLSLEQMTGLIGEASDLGAQGVTFAGGGDPLDNPATPRAISEAYDTYMETGIITNGYMLKEPAMMEAAKQCRWVRISIAAGTEKTYRELMHPPRDASLEALARHAEELRGAGVHVTVSYLAQKPNIGEIGEAAGIFAAAAQITVRPAYRLTPATQPPGPSDLPAVEKQAREAQERGINVQICTDRFLGTPPNPSCLAAPLLAVCQADGNIPVCCHKRYQPAYYIGNFLEAPLNEIWGSERHREALESVNPSACHHCRYGKYAEIIEKCYIDDDMHRCFI